MIDHCDFRHEVGCHRVLVAQGDYRGNLQRHDSRQRRRGTNRQGRSEDDAENRAHGLPAAEKVVDCGLSVMDKLGEYLLAGVVDDDCSLPPVREGGRGPENRELHAGREVKRDDAFGARGSLDLIDALFQMIEDILRVLRSEGLERIASLRGARRCVRDDVGIASVGRFRVSSISRPSAMQRHAQ